VGEGDASLGAGRERLAHRGLEPVRCVLALQIGRKRHGRAGALALLSIQNPHSQRQLVAAGGQIRRRCRTLAARLGPARLCESADRCRDTGMRGHLAGRERADDGEDHHTDHDGPFRRAYRMK
jgi:hypothetical protein